MPAIRNPKDVLCGLLLLAVAGVFAVGLLELPIGTAFRMGPGYFPLVLMLLLAGLGIAILVSGLRIEGEPGGRPVPWRALLVVTFAIVVFGTTLKGLGLVLALTAAVLIATAAARPWRPLAAFATTLTLVAGCVAVFSFGLGLPLSLFGPWVGGY